MSSIAPHAVRLEAARAVIEAVAARIDAGEGADGKLNTEGAIAKYTATETGNRAADAAIQAHGGYGYTREYLVEKIKRDVRITTIYEGTSEIMEMTIARDRWQQHLKSAGRYYPERAAELRALHARHPDVGAEAAALACEALAAVLDACRTGRLTRNQHVLLRLGELIAAAEVAGYFADRAATAIGGNLPEKADHRFDAKTLAAMSRVFARDSALKVTCDGLRWVIGANDPASTSGTPIAVRLGFDAVRAAQAGLIADMDRIADALYGRPARDPPEGLSRYALKPANPRPARHGSAPTDRHRRHGRDHARSANRRRVLGEHHRRALQHHRRPEGPVGSRVVLRPRPEGS
jgi:alkylation response protein AidB-like acyl-CoA dehydrogenase